MRKTNWILAVLTVSWTAWLLPNAAFAATPADPNQARIDELQHQVNALNQELNRLKTASDPTAQRQGMQRHWSMMQDHMRSVRRMPGMQAQGCRDWMMMDPGTMGPGMMGPGMMGKGMMDCPMTGHGMGQGGMWGMPSNMDPGLYQSQMHGNMTQMRSVSADVKLTHCAEVKVTHLGEDGGLLGRRHVDPGASSGDSDIGPARRVDPADQSADGAVAEHGQAVFAG